MSAAGLPALKAGLCEVWVRRPEIQAGLAGRFPQAYRRAPNVEEIGAEAWLGWAPSNSERRMETA